METNRIDLKTAIYIRFSTEKQDSEMQKHSISSFLRFKGIQDVHYYEDEAYSGKDDARPAFNTLIDDVKQGKVGLVIVYKLDRLTRSLSTLLGLLRTFNDHNVGFVSVTENLDLSTPSGRLMMQILGAFAEYEREMIATRVRDGLKAAKKRGAKIGRPKLKEDIKIRALQLVRSGVHHKAVALTLDISETSVANIVRADAKRLYALKSSTLRKHS